MNEDKIDQRDGSVIDWVTGQSQNRLFDYIINFKNICDRGKITKKRIFGAPDLIVEVLTESNWYNDVFRKYNKYRKAGVREYWIIIPDSFKVLVYEFEKSNSERPTEYTFADKVPVGIWDGKCEVDFKEIYEYIKFLL